MPFSIDLKLMLSNCVAGEDSWESNSNTFLHKFLKSAKDLWFGMNARMIKVLRGVLQL